MPDSPSAASTAAAAATESGKHCPPRITHDSGDFLVLHGKFGGANKGFSEAPKSCTRKEHESATNSIARRGQGAIAPCRVKGRRPLWGLGQRPNSSVDDQYAKRAQQRCRQRSVPASNSALPQERPQAALPPRFREKTFFLPASCRFPAKSLNPSEFFSETLLTNCLSFGILIKLNRFSRANMAQSVEQRFRKPQVEGSSPSVGSLFEV